MNSPTVPSIPNVFAIYRRETETFQLLQFEVDEHGNVPRLKNWAQPTFRERTNDPAVRPWINGQEWYVEPSEKQEETPLIHSIVIHDQTYHFWRLGYRLVWSNYAVHSRKSTIAAKTWSESPCIEVLEFSSRYIYPRVNTGFYPRWVSSKPADLVAKLEEGRDAYRAFQDTIDPRDLRIRTPRIQEDEYERGPMPISSGIDMCFQYCILLLLFVSILGMYSLIFMSVRGI